MMIRASTLLMQALLFGLSFTLADAQTNAAATPRLTLQFNGQNGGNYPYLVSGGVLMLPLNAFAAVGWRPLLDRERRIIDLAGCFRINTYNRSTSLIGGPASLGVVVVSQADPLPTSPLLRNGIYFVPAKAVFSWLRYGVVFDGNNKTLTVSPPSDPAQLTPTQEMCLTHISDQS